MAADTCSASSLAVGEPLAGSATQAWRWLLVEAWEPWARDVGETALPDDVAGPLRDFDGRAQLLRRPDRRTRERLAFVAETGDNGGILRRLDRLDDAAAGEVVDVQLVLVCCHGRRDPCCARLGTAVFDVLCEHVADDALWQSSHLGGHRFAANLLVLPAGVLLGRVLPLDAPRVAADLLAGRIPLEHYRGRTFHTPEAQAADAATRVRLGLTGFGDVSVLSADDGYVRLGTPSEEIDVVVERVLGPPVVESCGNEPVASIRYNVRW